MPQYSVEAKTQAVGLYESGLSCRAVAEQMEAEGVESPHFVTVLRWAKESGKGRRQRGRRFPISGGIVRALYERGMHAQEIAQQFHAGTTTIYKRLHEANARMRPNRIKYGHVLTQRRLRALYIRKDSRAQDIAAKFGCNVGTVYKWLKRTGIPLKRPRRTK